MAGGWAHDGAVQEQIDASIDDEVRRVRAGLGGGESLRACEECGASIPEARRRAVPGVRLCIACQEALDAERGQSASLLNRRASKDSQLR